jgi:hypothetical protein
VSDRLGQRARAEAIPLADAASLERVANRTRVLRLSLAAAVVAAVIATSVAAPDAQTRRFLPASTVGIVVLDISSSVEPVAYKPIVEQLRALSATDRRFGVVVFSDTAYEALPPGTPAGELKSFIRFFEPQRVSIDSNGNPLPRNPWEQTFSGGTNVSSGLALAAELLERPNVARGGVVLISDLIDDPSDYSTLVDTLGLYAERAIPLRIVRLKAPRQYRELFDSLVKENGVVTDARLPTGAAGRGRLTVEAPFPTWLAVLGGLAVALLAVELLWAQPFAWRRA